MVGCKSEINGLKIWLEKLRLVLKQRYFDKFINSIIFLIMRFSSGDNFKI
jgi:hypothetical protein